MGTVAYKELSAAEQIFKDVVWNPAVLAGETALSGAVPFLALPVIHQVEQEVLDQVLDWAFNQLVLLVDVTAIRFVNEAHQSAYDKASISLKIIALDHGIDSQEFKKAREDAALSFSKFVRFGATL